MELPLELAHINEELLFQQLHLLEKSHGLMDDKFSEEEREASWERLVCFGYIEINRESKPRRSEGGSSRYNEKTIRGLSVEGAELLQKLRKERSEPI